MGGHSSIYFLIYRLRMLVARAVYPIFWARQASVIFRHGRFGRKFFLAVGRNPGTRGNRKVSKSRLAIQVFQIAEKTLD
jgi:hypothetical protein